jgi:hypothetical protein
LVFWKVAMLVAMMAEKLVVGKELCLAGYSAEQTVDEMAETLVEK